MRRTANILGGIVLVVTFATSAWAAQAGNLPAGAMRPAARSLLNQIMVKVNATGGRIVACTKISPSAGRCAYTLKYVNSQGYPGICTGTIRVVLSTHYVNTSVAHVSCRLVNGS